MLGNIKESCHAMVIARSKVFGLCPFSCHFYRTTYKADDKQTPASFSYLNVDLLNEINFTFKEVRYPIFIAGYC